MAKGYDNIDDVKSKLAGTIIYYKGQPVVCKDALHCEENLEDFELLCTKTLTSGYKFRTRLSDPELNYTRFNLGYANYQFGALWWYRNPLRQYRQGLKAEQMKYAASDKTPDYGHNFNPSKFVEDMLLDIYPNIETIEQMLKDGERTTVAFHRDFALSWDKIHKDMIVEHKGKLIGCMTGARLDLRLSDDYEYLTETIKEVVGAR